MRSILVVVALTTTAHAWTSKQDGVDEAAKGTVLPVDAIATAKPGDWTILEGERRVDNKLVPERVVIRIGAPPEAKTTHVVWFRGAAGKEAPILAYVAGKHAIRVSMLGYASTAVSGFKTSTTTCKLAAELACTKVEFHHDAPGLKHDVVITMAPRVRGSGIVSLEVKDEDGVLWKLRTVGYGRATTTEWGASAPGENLLDPTYANVANVPGIDKRRNLVGLLYRANTFLAHTFPDFEVQGIKVGGIGGRTQNPEPKAVPGQPIVKGELDVAIVRRYIKRHLPKFRYCYEKELLAKPTLAGVVTATFEIGADGNVTAASATGVDPDLATCYADVIKAIRFPKPTNAKPVSVTYPFTLAR